MTGDNRISEHVAATLLGMSTKALRRLRYDGELPSYALACNGSRISYKLLDLVTYFTVGPKEARAWTITRGTKAPQAAGVIHTDFEKGFIRAETIAYDDYVGLGGEVGAKDAGKMRLEGKEYVVKDGDVMHFRFAN